MKLLKTFEDYKKIFLDYTIEYLNNEEGYVKDYIQLKITHTANVVKATERICNTLDISDDQKDIAKVIALFHDLGRFPQIKKYKRDDDATTENHAMLSLNEIREYDILKEENDDIKNIILKAIMYHNIASLPEDEEDENVLFYSKLIRDADKVDIYRVMIEDIYSKGYEYQKEMFDFLDFTPKTSDIVFNKIMNGEKILRNDTKTMIDHVLMQIAWAMNDINFEESKKIIRENHYIETIFESIETDDKAHVVYDKVMETLEGV